VVNLARESRLAATDGVRPEDGSADWIEAAALPELGLHWRILFEDGTGTLPLHGDSVAAAIRAGDITPDQAVVDLRSDETYQAVDVVCASLFSLNDQLRAELAGLREAAAIPQATSLPPEPPQTEWQKFIRELDTAKREASKYRKFLDDEQSRSRAMEENFTRMVDQYKTNERSFEERIRLLNQTRVRLESDIKEFRESLRSMTPDQELITLKELTLGNQEMARELTRLQEQLVEHDRQLMDAHRQRDAAEAESRERVRKLEELLAKERLETQKSRDQMVRLEHKHREMLSAYRELSDRLILMRNEALQRGLRTENEPPSAPSANAPRGADGPKVRLK
jgi:chromosome segregation ATPase